MLNMPILKFENSINYLQTQLNTQNNNKQLILDIITNIGLLINNSSEKDKLKYNEILESANTYLTNISSNITIIKQLHLEITNITKELNNILEEQQKGTKTKEFYITTFSNIKHNMESYSEQFQNIESKLQKDNKEFNEFININNFKYNFNSVNNEDNSNSYEFTGFSFNTQNEVDSNITNESNFNTTLLENSEKFDSSITSRKNINEPNSEIENLTNKFKDLLIDISEGNIHEDASIKIDEYIEEVKNNLSITIPNENIITENINDSETNDLLEENSIEVDSFVPVFFKYTDEDIEFLNEINKENEEVISENIFPDDFDEIISKNIIENINSNASANEAISEDTINSNISDNDFDDTIAENEISSTISDDEAISEDIINNFSDNDFDDTIIENEISSSISDNETIFEDIINNVSDNDFDDTIIENEISSSISDNETTSENTINNVSDNDSSNAFDKLISENTSNNSIDKNIFKEINENITSGTIAHVDINDIENLLANVKTSEDSTSESNIADNNESINEITEQISDEDILESIDDTDFILDILNENDDLLSSKNNENSTDTDENNKNIFETSNHEIKKDVFDGLNLSDEDINNKISNLLLAKTDNDNLIISEKNQKIYLPYKMSELANYMESYPNVYSSLQEVVKQEFILPFDYFQKHPFKSRFAETYNIVRNREGKNIFKSIYYSLNLAKRTNLNPAVIAACKSLTELESYLYYLDAHNLKRFKFFNIIYQINLI